MTTDERIEELRQRMRGLATFEDAMLGHAGSDSTSIRWLIAELRRAREALCEIRDKASNLLGHGYVVMDATFVLAEASRGLGDS